MDCLVQISIEGIGGLESKKGKNLIDILCGQAEQPSFFIRTTGTLGKNVIRFSTDVMRKRHQITWQQSFYRRASGLRVDWEDQFIKDKSQIPISKPRSGTVNDGKSRLIFELVRIDKFKSDSIIAVAEINPICVSILNAGTGDIDSMRSLFDRVYPLQLQGSLAGDVGNHDLSLRASVFCVPTVIPIMFSLTSTEDMHISFDFIIKEATHVPIKILKSATSFLCMIDSTRTNSVLSSAETLDPQWNETITITLPIQPSISKMDPSKPYLTIKFINHRGSGMPDDVIGEGTLSLWDFFSSVSKDKCIRVPLLRSGIEGEPTSFDMRGRLVLHIMEPTLTHQSANLFHNLYHELAIKKLDALYENAKYRQKSSLSVTNTKSNESKISNVGNQQHFLLNGSRHLKCLIICCMEDCDDEKAMLESEIIVQINKLLASMDISVEFCNIYNDATAHANSHLIRILVRKIFESEICVFVLGYIPGALVDRSGISALSESSFDYRIDSWLQSHFSEFEENDESLIELLSHAAQFIFREDPHVTEKVLMFQRQLIIPEKEHSLDQSTSQIPATETANIKAYNAAAVDRISRRISSFGASCFTHLNANSFVTIAQEKIVSSIQQSRLNGFRTHSLLNSSVFELQFMRSADSKPSNCHFFTRTHAFRTITLSLDSCSSGNITSPLFITSEDSLCSKLLYCDICMHMRSCNFKNLGSDITRHLRFSSSTPFKPCFLYDFSPTAGSKTSVTFFRSLLYGLRTVLASEPCILIDDVNFESCSVTSELIVLVKPLLKAAVEEYQSFSLLLSGIESLDPETLHIVLSILPACTVPGLWICILLGSRDAKYSCMMQSAFFKAQPCGSLCAMVRSQADTDAALVMIEECGVKHSSVGKVVQKFRHHPNLCSIALFISSISHAFSNCCGSDTSPMLIQLAQSTAESSEFADIVADILTSMHTFDNGAHVFRFIMLCSRSRYGLQPSDLAAMSNVSSTVQVVCVEILRAIGASVGCFCIVPFYEIFHAIDKVVATSADPRNAIRICDSTLLKHFSSMPVLWKVVENLIFASEITGEFEIICQRLMECSMQHYVVSNEFCIQDFRSFWQFFCKHPAGESISQRTRLLNHLSCIQASAKESCSSVVIVSKFCSLISLYETANSILKSFKALYQSDIEENLANMTSNDWSRLCIVVTLQGRLNLAWGRLDDAEGTLKEALTIHGSAIDSDVVASGIDPIYDASKAVCGRLLSDIASILLVRNKTREALSFADKGVAFIDGMHSESRTKYLPPSSILDIMLCSMEARLANNLKTGAFAVMESALKICDSEYGKFHPRSMAVYERLCSLNCMSDRSSEALAMYERISKDLSIQLAWGFDVTGKLTTILLLISDILVSSHEMGEAVAVCEQALIYRLERFEDGPSLQVARCLEKLAACRMHARDPKNAAQDMRDALSIRKKLLESKKDQDYFMCVLQLSGALKAAGYRSEARQHLKEWVDHLKEELGDDHEFVHTALDIIHSRMND